MSLFPEPVTYYLSYLIFLPDNVYDNRFGKFKCSEIIKNIICTKILIYSLWHHSLATFSMNVIESNIAMIHYSDTAEDLHKSINLEFLPTNN